MCCEEKNTILLKCFVRELTAFVNIVFVLGIRTIAAVSLQKRLFVLLLSYFFITTFCAISIQESSTNVERDAMEVIKSNSFCVFAAAAAAAFLRQSAPYRLVYLVLDTQKNVWNTKQKNYTENSPPNFFSFILNYFLWPFAIIKKLF